MPSIDVFDFTGGRNTRDGQLLVQNNQCVASSRNVWASGGTLSKLPGTLADGYDSAPIGFTSKQTFGQTMLDRSPRLILTQLATSTGEVRTYLIGTVASSVAGPHAFNKSFVVFNDNIDITSSSNYIVGYSTGSINVIVTAGGASFTATGAGTSWNNHIVSGDFLISSGTAKILAEVQEVVDATHLVIKTATVGGGGTYPATATGSKYDIAKFLKYQWPSAMAAIGSALYVSDGSGSYIMKISDGGNEVAVTASTTPVPRFLIPHKQRLFGFRIDKTGQKSRLAWSDLEVSGQSGGDNWPATNFIDIAKGVGGDGHGLFAVGNEILCFKERKLYKVIGDTFNPNNPDYSVVEIAVPTNFGFRQPYSILEHRGSIVFKADDGFYQYIPGTVFITRISEIIQEDKGVKELLNTEFPFPQTDLDFLYCASYKNRIYTSPIFSSSAPDTGDSSESFILNEKNSWWKFANNTATGGNYSAWNLLTYPVSNASVTGRRELTLVGTSPLGLKHLDTTAKNFGDNSTAKPIDSEWISKEFNIGYGVFKHLVIFLKKQTSGTLTVGWQIDQGTKVTEGIDMSKGRGTVIRRTINLNQKGSTIQIYLSNAKASEVFEVYGFSINYEVDTLNRVP